MDRVRRPPVHWARAELNGICLDVRVSDLMDEFRGEAFDVIVFNQPFYHPERPVAEDRVVTDTRTFWMEEVPVCCPVAMPLLRYSTPALQPSFATLYRK